MKKLQSIIAILVLVALIISIDSFSQAMITASTDGDSKNMDYIESKVEEVVFPHDQVVDVNIDIDEETYQAMIDNALAEEYVMADITYNGYTFNDIAIRPKGNSSLRDVANSGNDRFSYKIDFDKYIDGQNLFGITKLSLNNLFSDPSLMAEYLGYEMLDSIDAATPDTSYVALSINGEYYGLYLAVEAVDESFLMDEYDNYDGELYKPEMGIGSDLAYISDDTQDYTDFVPEDENMSMDDDMINFLYTIDQIIAQGGETEDYKLSDVMDVDSFLQYLAMSTASVHLDSYQGGMFHNYYLYYNTDTDLYEWISWDLNMIFNGFPQGGTDQEAVAFLIDEPVTGAMSQYPLVEAVFTNEEYVEQYHEYLTDLIEGYLEEDSFEQRVLDVYTMIEPYASLDTNPFYTFEESKASIFTEDKEATELSLLDYVSLRVDNIKAQLAGELPSTNNGQGNEGTSGLGGGMKGQDMDINDVIDQLPELPEGVTEEDMMEAMRTGELPEGVTLPEGMDLPTGMGRPDDRQGGPGGQGDMAGDQGQGMEAGRPEMSQASDTGVLDSSQNLGQLIGLGASVLAGLGFVIYLGIRKY